MTEHTPADDEFDPTISDRFARLERLAVPANWDRVVTRSLEPASEQQSRGRWLAIAAAVALLAAGVVGVAISRTSPDESPVADTIEPAPTLTDTDTDTVGSDGSIVVTIATTLPDEAAEPLATLESQDDVDATAVSVPVVQGLTEGEAVSVLRDLGLVVQVDRVEVQAGDPSDGRVVTQAPLAATTVNAGSGVRITIGQSMDPLTQTLIELDVDVASAPSDAARSDGAMFCGVERTGFEGFLSDDIDAEGRRCFLDHHAARLSAVFVSQNLTAEGDPVVIVMRSDSGGTVTFHVNSGKDAFGPGGWVSSRCVRLLDIGNFESSPTVFGCSLPGEPPTELLTEPIKVDPLPFPAWFEDRTDAPTCGFRGRRIADDDVADTGFDERSRRCMEDAIASGSRAELVTVTVGDDLRVSRWIVSLGPSPSGTEQFEVASLVVDLREGSTRWAETRCVEGEFVDGRLVGEYSVDREFVDQLDPSGTIVTDGGEVLTEPDPDDRNQLQPCNGPLPVERPSVTPFEATGHRIGDLGPRGARFPDFNEVGEDDITIARSWEPVGTSDGLGIIGFIPNVSLEFPPDPDATDGPVVIYADDGVTRVGEFRDGGAVLDP